MLDWSRLKPYHNNKHLSFEEFCYQISKCQFQSGFTRVDDTGGGDGVEFYRSLSNGDEWGWQAKFYYPEPRLSESNRKAHIENSLTTSCKNHPHLRKWILCTPTNLTPEENAWFNQELKKKIPANMTVELVHWGDSEFNEWIRQPTLAGIRNYFFGELELTSDWFKKRFENISTIYKDRFNPHLHTPTILDKQIQNVLAEPTLSEELHEVISEISQSFEEYVASIRYLRDTELPHIDWGTIKTALVTVLESNKTVVEKAIIRIKNVSKSLDEGLLDNVRSWSLSETKDFLTAVAESCKACKNAYSKFDKNALSYTGEKKEEQNALSEAARIVREPIGLATAIAESIAEFSRVLSNINRSNLNIIGGPGVGKTHLVSHIIDERVREGLPALLVPGSRFMSQQLIPKQLLEMLDIPGNFSWDEFLSALDSCAQAYHTRIPLVIDGLNETRIDGALSEIWKKELPLLTKQIEKVKNVVLITTCRASYVEAVWPNNALPDRVHLWGWESKDLNSAIQKYFAWYKIRGDLTTSSLRQFQNPIYLRIFCETKNPQRQQEMEVYVGEQTLFEIFDVWLNQCSQSICDRLNLHNSVPVAQDSIRKIAIWLWEKHAREVPMDELAEIVENRPLKELKWDGSWTKAILDEGLLVCLDRREKGEVAYFTYDLFGGYMIARSLVERETSNLDQFLKSQNITNELFGEDLKLRHPLYEDIARSLAVVLPSKTRRFLHEVREDRTAFNASIHGVFEVPPNVVSHGCVAIIEKLFQDERNRRPLLDLASYTMTQTNHPLNAFFWDEQLRKLTMAERDISWTEYVRENEDQFQDIVTRFERLCKVGAPISDLAKSRSRLLAQQLMWVLTSTIRPLRDQVTRALYWYGRRMPDPFFELVLCSLNVNDPYVPERMLAAAYGVVMARHIEFQDDTFATVMLRRYGEKLYEAMFKEGAPCATTHFLARDYARLTIELTALHHSDLLDSKQLQRIRPPFLDGGIRKWGESEDKNEHEYRDGNAPIHMDFGNYTMGRLIKDRANYDFENAEYKKIRANVLWRIYGLGYSLDKFGEIDKRINEMKWYGRRLEEGGQIDRYGKKYSWIAFFELAGLRQNEDLLAEFYGDPRISDCDVDPSFPENIQEYQIKIDDFLEIDCSSNQEWIERTIPPDMGSTLLIPKILGDYGPWVLLDGVIVQEGLQANRDSFLRARCLLVRNADSEEFMNLLKKNSRVRIPSVPEDYYTYAGEIPWCDTFPNNGNDEMELVVKTKREIRRVTKRTESGFIFEEQEVEIPAETRKITVFVPVRYNCYESYHSEVNPGRSVLVPARELSDFLELCSQPQTFDMYEKDGRKASITVKCGKPYHDSQLIFLRQDLLDRFLEERDLSLVWAIEGERRLWSKEKRDFLGPLIEKYTPFFKVLMYTPSKA